MAQSLFLVILLFMTPYNVVVAALDNTPVELAQQTVNDFVQEFERDMAKLGQLSDFEKKIVEFKKIKEKYNSIYLDRDSFSEQEKRNILRDIAVAELRIKNELRIKKLKNFFQEYQRDVEQIKNYRDLKECSVFVNSLQVKYNENYLDAVGLPQEQKLATFKDLDGAKKIIELKQKLGQFYGSVLLDDSTEHVFTLQESVAYNTATVEQREQLERDLLKQNEEKRKAHPDKVHVKLCNGKAFSYMPDEKITHFYQSGTKKIMSPKEYNQWRVDHKTEAFNFSVYAGYSIGLVCSVGLYKLYCDEQYKKAIAEIKKNKKLSVQEKQEQINQLSQYKPTKVGAAVMAGWALAAPLLYKLCKSQAAKYKAEHGV